MTNDVRELIKKYNIKLKKNLGQNFLCDVRALNDIVKTADINHTQAVIEIGAGIGNMTRLLASKACAVVAVEIDKNLIPALKNNVSPFSNVSILNKDIMKIDLNNEIIQKIFKPVCKTFNRNPEVKVAANLPYYITTPVIMKFLEEAAVNISTMVFMVQKEVADRLLASSGSRTYGAVSVAVQYYSRVTRVFNVPAHCFIPRPTIDSTVIKLDIYKRPPVKVADTELFFRIIKAAFSQRRKTLANSLYNCLGTNMKKEEIKKIISNTGMEENIRGEQLSIHQFAALANQVSRGRG